MALLVWQFYLAILIDWAHAADSMVVVLVCRTISNYLPQIKLEGGPSVFNSLINSQ